MLRLGIIGLSDGNGHPFSWSAIFNGYDIAAMEKCGFPVIPRYLAQHAFPRDAIPTAKVTHVWTQDIAISRQIAHAAMIPNIVDHYKDMIGQVDAILLARDDAENHTLFAAPFLEAGLPIYIDKPLALTRRDAQALLNLQRYPGQIFSCSALKYAKEFEISPDDRASIGAICHVHAVVPKDWNKYAIHIIDPILKMLGHAGHCSNEAVIKTQNGTSFHALHSSGAHLHLAALGSIPAPIEIVVFGENASRRYRFEDSFHAFKMALTDFVEGIICKDIRSTSDQILAAIDIVEAGSGGAT